MIGDTSKGCNHSKTWAQDCVECDIVWAQEAVRYHKEGLAKWEARLKSLTAALHPDTSEVK